MNIEYYRNFISVAESGSILAASRSIPMAQPALSHQMRAMERELGAELFVRGPRRIALTEAGKILYQKAKSICALADAAKAEIADSAAGVAGTLHIALPPTNSPAFLSRLFADFLRRFPNVRLDIHESTSQEVSERVAEGVSEIGVIRAPILNAHLFERFPMKSERVSLVIPSGHPLEGVEGLKFSDLRGLRLAVPRGCAEAVMDAGARAGFIPDIFVSTTSYRAAVGVAVLSGTPALVPKDETETFSEFKASVRDFDDCVLEVPRALITRKGSELSAAARNFLSFHFE